MRILDTILRLLPYQRTMLETDIPTRHWSGAGDLAEALGWFSLAPPRVM